MLSRILAYSDRGPTVNVYRIACLPLTPFNRAEGSQYFEKKWLFLGQATSKIWLPKAISDLPTSIQIINGPQQKLTFI